MDHVDGDSDGDDRRRGHRLLEIHGRPGALVFGFPVDMEAWDVWSLASLVWLARPVQRGAKSSKSPGDRFDCAPHVDQHARAAPGQDRPKCFYRHQNRVAGAAGLLGLWLSTSIARAANFTGFWRNASLSLRHPYPPDAPSWMIGTVTLIAVAMVGSLFSMDAWNNITFTAAEVKNPGRNLPISLALGTGTVILLYTLANFAYLRVLPLSGDPNGATVLSRGIEFAADGRVATATVQAMLGPAGAILMALAILVSTFGCNNGLILSGARIYYAMAKDRLFFASAGTVNRHHAPGVALAVQCLWASVLCLSGTYGQLLDFLIFAVMIFYILTLMGLFLLRWNRPNLERPYRAFGYPFLPALYILMAVFLEIQLLRYKPQYTWPGLIIVLLGLPVYAIWSWAGKRAARA